MSTEVAETAVATEVAAARTRAVEFLLRHIYVDGTLAVDAPHWTLGVYYRLPWTLAICGERTAAAEILSWVSRNALTSEGDLVPAAQRGYEELFAPYPLANLGMGAWLLERYDIAGPIMETLGSSFQDSESGGAYSERPEYRRTGRQDLFPTAQLGLSALMTGRLRIADGAAKWFRSLWDAQPELPDALYSAWMADGPVLTWPPETLRGVDPAFWHVTHFTKGRQAFYNPGIAAAFLGRYAMATGDRAALDLARSFLELSAGATDQQFDHSESKQVCKFAWGASVVYQATSDPQVNEWVTRMAHWFVESQEPDGCWHNSPFLSPEPSLATDLNITAEFALHLTTILGALGSSRTEST